MSTADDYRKYLQESVEEQKEKPQINFGVLWYTLYLLVILVPSMIWQGFVVMKLWNWFMADYFNIAKLDILHAAMLNLLTAFLIIRAVPSVSQIRMEFNLTDEDKDYYKRIRASIYEQISIPGAFLLTGWIAKTYFM